MGGEWDEEETTSDERKTFRTLDEDRSIVIKITRLNKPKNKRKLLNQILLSSSNVRKVFLSSEVVSSSSHSPPITTFVI